MIITVVTTRQRSILQGRFICLSVLYSVQLNSHKPFLKQTPQSRPFWQNWHILYSIIQFYIIFWIMDYKIRAIRYTTMWANHKIQYLLLFKKYCLTEKCYSLNFNYCLLLYFTNTRNTNINYKKNHGTNVQVKKRATISTTSQERKSNKLLMFFW